MNRILISLIALVAVSGAAFAQKAAAKPAVKVAKIVAGKCAVTGEKIADISKADGGKSVYKGKTYYFCCAGCKPQFDKAPATFVAKIDKAAAKPTAKPVKKS